MYRTTGVKAVKKEASHGVKVSVLSELLSLGPGETTRVLRSGVVCLLRLVGVHILTLALFPALDAVWLGLIARDMYRRELSQLLAPGVQWQRYQQRYQVSHFIHCPSEDFFALLRSVFVTRSASTVTAGSVRRTAAA